jgi:hypothetical protein
MEDIMKRLHLAAALLVAGMAGPAFAQNVQNRLDPQNPADVTQASPAGYGATKHLLKHTAALAERRYQHHAKGHHDSAMQHQTSPDIDSK